MNSLALSALTAVCLLESTSLRAQTVFSTDFETGSLPPEISGAGVVNGSEGYSAFGFGSWYLHNSAGGDPASPTTLTLVGLPDHIRLKLEFDLAIIDSWDGLTTRGGTVPPDYFNLYMDGELLFSEAFDNFDPADQPYSGSSPVLRRTSLAQNSAYPDSVYKMVFYRPHSGPTLSLEWFASGGGWQGGLDESWGIDNLSITLRGESVPDGGHALAFVFLFAAGLAAMGGRPKA